ncbi:MAG: glycosyltransferase family 2 protein, partial [Kosmotogaceae bacterium]
GIYKRYGMPNDMLVKLNIYNFRVRDVEIQPIYGIGEKSGIKPLLVIPRFSWLLTRLFFHRMFQKYIIRDFHPLVFFYLLSFILITLGSFLSVRMFVILLETGIVPPINALAVFFSFIVGVQMLLFAMWFDMDSNKHLR